MVAFSGRVEEVRSWGKEGGIMVRNMSALSFAKM